MKTFNFEGIDFSEDTPYDLAMAIGENQGRSVIGHFDGDLIDVQPGRLSRTGGRLKAPLLVPFDDVGAPEIMTKWMIALYSEDGALLWKRDGDNPWNATRPATSTELYTLGALLNARPMRPLIVHVRGGAQALHIGKRTAYPEYTDDDVCSDRFEIGFHEILLTDVLEVWSTYGDLLWGLPIGDLMR